MRVLLCEASLRVSFFVHVNMSDSENLSEEMWEENRIDSGGFSEISSPDLSHHRTIIATMSRLQRKMLMLYEELSRTDLSL